MSTTHTEAFDFEIKVKIPRIPWEQIEPLKCQTIAASEDDAVKEMFKFCRSLTAGHNQEVRWNFPNSPQGHYVSAQGKESP